MAYYNCLLIDADGTLLDFEASQRKALAAALGQFGIPAEEAVLALYARINGELWRALERGEIRSTLSASGTITSGTVCEVSTTLTYPVAELKVAVGDRVNEGDVIALLDTESLDADIATHQKEQNASAQKAQMAVDQAARRLEDAKNKKKIDEERWGEMDEDSWNDLLRSDSLAIEDAQDALNGAILDQQSQSSNELQKLYQNKADCTITAPKAGVITSLAKVAHPRVLLQGLR